MNFDHLEVIPGFETSVAQRAVNSLTSEEKEMVSDGYHTFGELYEHRLFLFIALCNVIEATSTLDFVTEPHYLPWKSRKHFDGSEWEGWFIAGIGTAKGITITYHLPNRLYDYLNVRQLDNAPEWDGHDSNDVLERLAQKFFPLKIKKP